MVSFKFRTSKTVNFATDVPSKHGFHLNDLNRICVYLHYGAEDLRINGFTPKNVSQVITGAKKSHAGYIFLDFLNFLKKKKKSILI